MLVRRILDDFMLPCEEVGPAAWMWARPRAAESAMEKRVSQFSGVCPDPRFPVVFVPRVFN